LVARSATAAAAPAASTRMTITPTPARAAEFDQALEVLLATIMAGEPGARVEHVEIGSAPFRMARQQNFT